MKAVCVYFDALDYHEYHKDEHHRMAQVLRSTWRKNSKVPIEFHNLGNVTITNNITKPHHNTRRYANTLKLEWWVKCFDQDTIFLDCDMICLRDVSDGFDHIDYAGLSYLVNRNTPFNGGVFFVKYNERGKGLMKDLLDINQQMFDDPEFHRPWNKKYAGQNQAALGYLLEHTYPDIDFLPPEFNLCYPYKNWEKARLVHIHNGKTRGGLFNKREDIQQFKDLIDYWHECEQMV